MVVVLPLSLVALPKVIREGGNIPLTVVVLEMTARRMGPLSPPDAGQFFQRRGCQRDIKNPHYVCGFFIASDRQLLKIQKLFNR